LVVYIVVLMMHGSSNVKLNNIAQNAADLVRWSHRFP